MFLWLWSSGRKGKTLPVRYLFPIRGGGHHPIHDLAGYIPLLKKRAAFWHRRMHHVMGMLLDEDDFFQIGMVGLASLSEAPNLQKASRVIDNKIRDSLRSSGTYSRREIHQYKKGDGVPRIFMELEKAVPFLREPSISQLEQLIRKNLIITLYGALTCNERLVLIEYLSGNTLKQAGERIGVTESRACQIWNVILSKGAGIMNKETSGKWKVFAALKAHTDPVLAENLAIETGVPVGTVRTYLQDFRRAAPDNIKITAKIEQGNLYKMIPGEESPDSIYTKIKAAALGNKTKKEKPAFTPAERGVQKKEKPATIYVQLTLEDLDLLRRAAYCISNPTVAFSFDQKEMFQNVIRSQQGIAENIIALLAKFGPSIK